MKRRLIMGLAAVAAVFAAENLIDIVVSRYVDLGAEIMTWFIIALVAAIILYEVGEDRGDW